MASDLVTLTPGKRDAPDGSISTQRDTIRRAAIRLFNSWGYESTSVKRIAQAMNMAPANLYNYYASKEALLFDVMQCQLDQVLARERRIVEEHQYPAERLRELAWDLVMHDLRDPLDAFVGIHGLRGLTGARRETISEMMAAIRSIWIATIAQGAAEGIFIGDDPKLAALVVLTMCSSVASWYVPTGEYAPDRVADHVADSVVRSLAVRPVPEQAGK